MSEISRCCRVLNVKHGASLEEVKAAYRDLVQVWHPDRFSGNERLQIIAQERLKEINLAWDFLHANAFQEGILHEPTDDALIASSASDSPSASDESACQPTVPGAQPSFGQTESSGAARASSRTGFWLLTLAVIAVLASGGLLFFWPHSRAPRAAPGQPAATVLAPLPPGPNLAESATVPGVFPFATNILAGNPSTNASGWHQAPPLLTPPFAIRLKLAVNDLAEFRLHFGLGQLVFNWAEHPKELLVGSPRDANFTSVPGQGFLTPNETHEILCEVDTNALRVQVDGKSRFATNGNFAGIKGYVSLAPSVAPVSLETFIVETPQPLEAFQVPTEGRAGVAGNLVSSMLPEKNLSPASEPDGRVIQTASDSANRLMTSQSFRSPLIIRTRAKTDAYNLRLYCGVGMIIFNWELNERELRVHDPVTGQALGVSGQGLISPNDWHTIVWDIQAIGMKLSVDGQVRFQNHKDYRALIGKAGIGAFRSKVTVDYFRVEEK